VQHSHAKLESKVRYAVLCMCWSDKDQQHISDHAVMNVLPLTTDVNKSTVSGDDVTTRTNNVYSVV